MDGHQRSIKTVTSGFKTDKLLVLLEAERARRSAADAGKFKVEPPDCFLLTSPQEQSLRPQGLHRNTSL